MRRSIGRLLRASGFECSEHDSGEALLQSHDLDACDCVVSDIHLPGLNGFELIEHLRRIVPAMPAVIVTAYDEPKSQTERLRNNRVAYLAKPFESAALLAAIRKVTVGDLGRIGQRAVET